ncbi:unnamed protein product [Danaus chrysippus]|uniref:(African queen) hypothetical protein n=1 Tax=Danaus chrysippus TaxID=151541 RepID=A0A8J2QUN3_9NEOP|nr:unnamed protein product [Danaus chrysippus]
MKFSLSSNVKLCEAYEAYFNLPIRSQDKIWAPKFSCSYCKNTLEAWYRGEKKSMKFAVPRIWREPTNHISDCYFCLVNPRKRRAGKNAKKIQYPELPSTTAPVPHSEHFPVPSRSNLKEELPLSQDCSSSEGSEFLIKSVSNEILHLKKRSAKVQCKTDAQPHMISIANFTHTSNHTIQYNTHTYKNATHTRESDNLFERYENSTYNGSISNTTFDGNFTEYAEIPYYIKATSMTFCIVIMCLGVIGNVMVPIVILKTKDMRNSTNIFLVNLSIADLMVLLVCTPTVLVEVNSKPETWVLGKELYAGVIKMLKLWLGLALTADSSALFRDRNSFGMNLKRPSELYKHLRVSKRHILGKSHDDVVTSLPKDNDAPELESRLQFHKQFMIGAQNNRVGLGSSRKVQDTDILKSFIRQDENDKYKIHAMSLEMQNEWLDIGDFCIPLALKWRTLIHDWSPALLKFYLNAFQMTLPDQSNLVRWGKGTEKTCYICGKAVGTAKHLLVGCRVLLDSGQYSRRHDRVLEIIRFVREGTRAIKSNVKPYSILKAASDWTIMMDTYEKQYKIPEDICASASRPDIFLYSRILKRVVMIELTVPWETNIPKDHAIKVNKYYELTNELTRNRFVVDLYAVEVGARGITAKSLYNLLKDLGLSRTNINSFLERTSKAALVGSFQIWLGRERNLDSGGLAVPFVELTVAHASVLTILAISFERYYAICEPLRAGYVCTKTRATLICALAWFFAALFTSPILAIAEIQTVTRQDGTFQQCLTQAVTFWQITFFMTVIILLYLLPLFILVVLYTVIAKNLITAASKVVLNKTVDPYNVRARKQVILMLGTVVLCFFLCLMPYRVLALWIIITPSELSDNVSPEKWTQNRRVQRTVTNGSTTSSSLTRTTNSLKKLFTHRSSLDKSEVESNSRVTKDEDSNKSNGFFEKMLTSKRFIRQQSAPVCSNPKTKVINRMRSEGSMLEISDALGINKNNGSGSDTTKFIRHSTISKDRSDIELESNRNHGSLRRSVLINSAKAKSLDDPNKNPILGVATFTHERYHDGTEVPVCLTQADTFWSALFFILIIAIFFIIPLGVLLVLYSIIAKNLMENPIIISQQGKNANNAGNVLRYRKQNTSDSFWRRYSNRASSQKHFINRDSKKLNEVKEIFDTKVQQVKVGEIINVENTRRNSMKIIAAMNELNDNLGEIIKADSLKSDKDESPNTVNVDVHNENELAVEKNKQLQILNLDFKTNNIQSVTLDVNEKCDRNRFVCVPAQESRNIFVYDFKNNESFV